MKTKHYGRENKGNDHVRQLLLVSTMRNIYNGQYREYICTLGLKAGLNDHMHRMKHSMTFDTDSNSLCVLQRNTLTV